MISINDAGQLQQNNAQNFREGMMPADALLVTVIVVAIFVVFGVTLAWADRQTSSHRLDSDSKR
ncbi:hypothetical protein [Bradyrhizobium amphicarpaeae]|uniref:Uncharacterized protein n=1 Tax=Bradyrhizobium amphicarpaeae TaxID=1404768 RepID=A0A2U8PXC5_9BRAD|nr:hypothetical protein [Bradyrhizobium amphicarpaeae]AWM02486.1 hypothetical protein CIT40_22275 [Bradyrhizobium amphicarpaeae]